MSYGYLGKMLTLLTGAYNRRDIKNAAAGRPMETNIGRLFSLLADGLEMVHTTTETVRLWDDLDNAEGAVLDRYGANFGVARGEASDPLYRILIRVKMIAQVSGGDGDTVIRAASELLGIGLTDIALEDVYPAKIRIFVDMSLLSEERLRIIKQISRAIKRILAAGVGMQMGLRIHPEKAQAVAVGRFVGSRREVHVAITTVLKKPQGTARAMAGAAVCGSRQSISVTVQMPAPIDI